MAIRKRDPIARLGQPGLGTKPCQRRAAELLQAVGALLWSAGAFGPLLAVFGTRHFGPIETAQPNARRRVMTLVRAALNKVLRSYCAGKDRGYRENAENLTFNRLRGSI